jgi:hypothetical protein
MKQLLHNVARNVVAVCNRSFVEQHERSVPILNLFPEENRHLIKFSKREIKVGALLKAFKQRLIALL